MGLSNACFVRQFQDNTAAEIGVLSLADDAQTATA
jgi:hypothetical protein